MTQQKRRTLPLTCVLLLVMACILAGGMLWLVESIPAMAQEAFGIPNPRLGFVQRIQYSTQLLMVRHTQPQTRVRTAHSIFNATADGP